MKKIVLLLALSLTAQVNYANNVADKVISFQTQEPYNAERLTEYTAALKTYLNLSGSQQAAAKANIMRYLKDKHILDKSANGLSQSEYNYRLEKLKIQLTYKLKTTLSNYQVQQIDNILSTNETTAVRSIKHMLFV
nr:hypothetical protein [uncultured Flavobacterium sp.]